MAPPSFDQVYEECHRQVFALCRHLLGNPVDAQDALQETFLAVARALPGFRGESSVRTWVHRIAVRTALKLRARRPAAVEELDAERHGGSHDPAARHLDGDQIARAMAALSFEHRLVLSLFGVAGLTHGEIAVTLGIAEGTVWSRLHHAKKKLAAELAAAGEAEAAPARSAAVAVR
jgi:RNA polymerase sigma-70 factor, ECF subfamily